MSLHDAALAGDATAISMLVAGGAAIDDIQETSFASSCSTPLHVAAENGHLSCVTRLLELGASMDACDLWGHSAVHLAAACGHAPVIQALVAHDAAVMHIRDDVERTALHMAAQHGEVLCVGVLLKHGALSNPVDAYHAPGEAEVLQTTALHSAAASGHSDCLQMLLAAEEPEACNWKDAFARTPLHKAAECGSVRCIQVLIAGGADPNAVTKWGASPLHLAIKHKHSAAAQCLLDYGAEPRQRDRRGFSALHAAAQEGLASVASALINRGADVNCAVLSACAQQVDRPLRLALENGHADVVGILIRAGASLKCLESMLGSADLAMVSLVRSHVQQVSLVTALSFTSLSPTGSLTSGLERDTLHAVLCRVFDISQYILRLLLNIEAERPLQLS